MQSDIRLSKAYEQIDAGNVKILSLDIFDTLLWRKCPIPVDLFLILGQKLKEEGWLIDTITPEGFADLRILSEQLVRQKKIQRGIIPEITLQEIYWNFAGIFNQITIEEMIEGKKGIINESDINDLLTIEIALEKQFTQFDHNILRLIHYARKSQIPVTLMSDTYLTQEHITTILDRLDPISGEPFLEQIYKLYISNEQGCGKQLGLFFFMLNDLQISPEYVLHIGDNQKSDCTAAEQAKIPSIYYQKGEKNFGEILDREWPKKNKNERRRQLDLHEGDFGLTTIRSKLMHHGATANMNATDAFFWKYGATILGPVTTGFVRWIYQRCKEIKESDLFCLMREGQFYSNLIRHSAEAYPETPLKTHELWVSRQYMMRTCLFEGSSEELLRIFQSAIPYTVREFCASLGLKIEEIGKFATYANVKMDYEILSEDLIKHICNHPLTKEKILQRSFEARKRFLKYLSTLIDLKSISRMTVVDVGWKGTIQGAIQMVLYKEGYPIKVHGFYLATQENVNFALMQGLVREGYLLKSGLPVDSLMPIRTGIHALEQLATTGLQPLSDYDSDGQVIHKKIRTYPRQLSQVDLMRKGVNAFCELLNEYTQSGAISWNATSPQLEEQLRQILVRSTSLPTKREASFLGTWRHDPRSGVNISPLIAKDSYYDRFASDMFPNALLEDPAVIWPSAYAAKCDNNMAEALQAILQKKISPQCFLSHDTFPLKVFLDTGNGFPKKAAISQLLRSNPNGSFYAFEKLYSLKQPIKKLQLQFTGSSSSILHFKSLRLTLNTLKTVKSVSIVLFESSVQKSGVLLECNVPQIELGIFNIENRNATFTFTFELPDIYAIQMRLCCCAGYD